MNVLSSFHNKLFLAFKVTFFERLSGPPKTSFPSYQMPLIQNESLCKISQENEFKLHENELWGKQIFCHMNGFTQRLTKDNSKMTYSSDLHVHVQAHLSKTFTKLFAYLPSK